MINQKRIQLTKIALALSIALSATPSFAQNTTSAIGGRISGADGQPAGGATVSIIHTESGSVSNVVTDAQGRYVARGLRAGGPYTIVITKNGVTERRENVYTNLAETASVDATIGAPIQTVTITGQTVSDKINSSAMGAGTNIGRAQINALGSVQRSLADYARLDPRLSQTDKGRGEISVGGQNARYNSITVDGVSISDTFGLEGNGLPTDKQPISIDAIQSVQVNISNYDVTQKGYTGANINAVTKSGTNQWKGSLYALARDERAVGKQYNVTTDQYNDQPDFYERTKGVTLGGPLIKDTLFMFLSMEDTNSSRTSPTFGPLGSNLTNVGITGSAITGAQNVAKGYGFDIGGADVPAGTELTVSDRLLKLDWNINDNHRANVRWQQTKQSEPRFSGYGTRSISLSSYLFQEEKQTESVVAQLFSDWSPTFSTEFKISRRDNDKISNNNAFLPAIALNFPGPLPTGTPETVLGGTRTLRFGTENFRHFNLLKTETIDAYFGATLVRGDHEIKVGGDYQSNDIFNAFVANANGNYSFGCQNSSATFTYTIGAVNCSTSSAAIIEQAVLENFRRGRPQNYQATLPTAGRTLNDGAAVWTLDTLGLFLQDTWKVNKQLNLTYGVRYDKASTNDRPVRNAAIAQPRVAGVYNADFRAMVRDSGGLGVDNTVTIDGDSLIQPRFGFNYRLNTARATQVRGGAGLFQGSALNVWLGNPFANNGVGIYTTGCGTAGFAPCRGEGLFVADPRGQQPIAGIPPASNVDILAPGIAQPSVYKANLGVEHELPWFGMVASAEYLYTKTNKSIFYRNLNLGAPTRIGPDGREMYFTGAGYLASCATATGTFRTDLECQGYRTVALSNPGFGQVMEARNSELGGGQLVTLSVGNSRSKGPRWSLAYTYTEAEDVNPLTSSQAASNWSANPSLNPNDEVLANSSYLVKDRVNASLTWEKAFFGKYKTTFGAFYEGRTGKPYSWTYSNDMNGDSISGNDLMYIPSAFGSGEVLFFGDTATNKANEQKFWDIVNSNKELLRNAGGLMKRNDSFSPWTNSIDLRVSQEVPGLFKGNKGVFVLDIANFGNMLNKRWGRINEVGFATAGGASRNFVDYAGMQDGKYVYRVENLENYTAKNARQESQWVVQATVRYEF
ncbi:TonB-dependent receptor [Massilia sp. PAMC28688]|uniref:TonB-dependent receptor n=1 Tax=Massilia sp. PAMC28688 TaxID=2861283 RepID=UPI001C6347A4|nr:TonB-dependent receptor [Massilia sp. PAMC28688]QYF94337.1 TonB-dependent receptor [Massilia sp. PAMC28688]